MLKYIKLMLPYAAILFLGACDDDKLDLYKNDPKLYFFKGNYNYGEIWQKDSIGYSFRTIDPGETRDTLYIWAWTMGFPSGEAREYVLGQMNTGDPDAAVPGLHYVSFDDPEYRSLLKVPANIEKFQVPVIILKDPSLNEKEVRLQIGFKENQNFKPGIKEQISFVVRYSNLLTKPETWDTWWIYAFGVWSADKMEFVIRYVGLTDFENVETDFSMCYYYKALAIQKRLEYPDEYPGVSFD